MLKYNRWYIQLPLCSKRVIEGLKLFDERRNKEIQEEREKNGEKGEGKRNKKIINHLDNFYYFRNTSIARNNCS